MRVFVLGATGDQGQALVARLLAEGHVVTAGVRDPARAPSGTAAMAADLADADGLARAMAGQDALAMHLPFVHDPARAAAMGATIAQAVRQAGIARVVFNTSCIVRPHDLGLGAHDGRRAIEAALAASGAAFASIRPTAFMDNLVRPWARPAIVERGVFAYPAAPTLHMSWVAIGDVAAAMAAVLARNDMAGMRITLGGPEALVGDEVAERLSAAVGRSVRFVSLDPADFAASMAELVTGRREVPEGSVYHGMSRFYTWYNGQSVSPLAVTDNPLGLRLTPFADWARRQEWRPA